MGWGQSAQVNQVVLEEEGLFDIDYAALETRMAAVMGVPGDMLMGRGVYVRCSRCGSDKGGSHPRAFCSAKMIERDLRDRGYVPLLGNEVKLAKMGRVKMVKRPYMDTVKDVRDGNQFLKLYGPIWFVYLAQKARLANMSYRRPVVRDFITRVRTINCNFEEQKFVAAEILLTDSEHQEAARAFLKVYSVENVDLEGVRERHLRIMRGGDRPEIL